MPQKDVRITEYSFNLLLIPLAFTRKKLAIAWAKILELLPACHCLFLSIKIQVKPSKRPIKQLLGFVVYGLLYLPIVFV